MTQALHLVYFSPTGTTRAALRRMAEAAQASAPGLEIHEHDGTLPTERAKERRFSDKDWVIFGMPVYYGRIPALFHSVTQWQGSNTKAACVVVYGDRAYEDALLELTRVVGDCGFVPVAAAAVVAEHSLQPLLGQGRPHAEDVAAQKRFGENVLRRFVALSGLSGPSGPSGPSGQAPAPLSVPGNTPYKAYGASPFIPATDKALCTQCGVCAACCPTGCISEDDYSTVRPEHCICCRACVKYCPAECRLLPGPLAEQFDQRMAMLRQMAKGNNAVQVFGV